MSRFRRVATYDGPKNCANAPCWGDQGNVYWPLLDAGNDAEKGQAADVHPTTANSCDRSTNDEGIHRRRGTGYGASNLKDGDASKVQPFEVEERVGLGPDEHKGS